MPSSSTIPLAYPAHQIEQAIEDCRTTARAIADDLSRRATAAAVARADWAGVHRRSFDATFGSCYAHLVDLHDRLLRLALALQADQVAADHENAIRAARRADAEAEHRRQEQQAAAAGAAAVTP